MISNLFRRITTSLYSNKLPVSFFSTGNVESLWKSSARKVQPAFSALFLDPSLMNQKKKVTILDNPVSHSKFIFDIPKKIISFEDINISTNVIEDPGKVIEKKAARLVVIRRRKMRRHKLKKLRKKMKLIWRRVRQKREMKKEKAFQAELMGQIKEAEKFDAVAYVREKISKARYEPEENVWPETFPPEKIAYLKKIAAKKERRKFLYEDLLEKKKNMSLNPSDYKF